MGVEPVDDFSFTEHKERLQGKGTGQRSDRQVRGHSDELEIKKISQRSEK